MQKSVKSKINCKPNLIRQAFSNLLLNAYDALENASTKKHRNSF